MTKRALLAVALFAFAFPLYADFDAVARAIGSKRGVNRISIPFIGVARFAVWIVQPQGVHDFQLATFKGGDMLERGDVDAILRSTQRSGYMPLVQVWSRKKNEWAFVYARPSKTSKRMDLLILAKDHADTTLVSVEVDMDVFIREMDHPRVAVNIARR